MVYVLVLYYILAGHADRKSLMKYDSEYACHMAVLTFSQNMAKSFNRKYHGGWQLDCDRRIEI